MHRLGIHFNYLAFDCLDQAIYSTIRFTRYERICLRTSGPWSSGYKLESWSRDREFESPCRTMSSDDTFCEVISICDIHLACKRTKGLYRRRVGHRATVPLYRISSFWVVHLAQSWQKRALINKISNCPFANSMVCYIFQSFKTQKQTNKTRPESTVQTRIFRSLIWIQTVCKGYHLFTSRALKVQSLHLPLTPFPHDHLCENNSTMNTSTVTFLPWLSKLGNLLP